MPEVKEKAPSYQRYPKQILGDDKVLLMDWDTVGMHNWLLDIAWQQEQRGTLPDDEDVIRRWLKKPTDEVWERVWGQLKPSWPVVSEGLRGNMGMIAVSVKQENYSKSNRDKKNKNSTKAPTFCESLPEQNGHKSIEDEEEVEEAVVVALEVQEPIVAVCEMIYNAYPRKVGRPEALRQIREAIKRRVKSHGVSEEDSAQFIHQATLEYARSPTAQDKKFVPHPERWFKRNRFDDDRADWYRSGDHGQNGTQNGITKAELIRRANERSERETNTALGLVDPDSEFLQQGHERTGEAFVDGAVVDISTRKGS